MRQAGGGRCLAAEMRRYVARSAAICLAGLALNQALAQAAGSALARVVPDPHLYGVLALLLQYLNLAALGLGLGLDSALVYDLATGHTDGRRSFAAAWSGMVGLAVIPMALAVALGPMVGRAYGIRGFTLAVGMGCGALVAQAGLNAALAAQSGLRRFGPQMALMVVATLLAWAGRLAVVPAVRAGASAGLVPLAGALGLGLVAAAGIWAARRLPLTHPGDPSHASRPWWAEVPRMLRYGWPLWAGNLLKAFQQPYLVLLGGAVAVADAGLMGNAITLIGWPFLATWAFRLVAVPLVASGRSLSERRARLALCFRLNHLLLFPLVALLVFWAKPLVTALYGARYVAGAAVLPALALGVYGSSLGRLATDALAGVGRTRESLPIMLFSSLPLLVLGPLVAHHLRWLGALYCAGWLASGLFALLLLRRVGLSVDLRAAFVEPLLPTVCALPFALWVTRLGGIAARVGPIAALAVLVVVTVAVYRWEPSGIGGTGTVPLGAGGIRAGDPV